MPSVSNHCMHQYARGACRLVQHRCCQWDTATAAVLTLRAGLPSSPILSLLMWLSQLLQYVRTSAGFVAGRPSMSSWRTVTCRRAAWLFVVSEGLGQACKSGDESRAVKPSKSGREGRGGEGFSGSNLLSCEASVVQILLALRQESSAVRAVTSVHRRRLSADGQLVLAARAGRWHGHGRRTGHDRAALQGPTTPARLRSALMNGDVKTRIAGSQRHHQCSLDP